MQVETMRAVKARMRELRKLHGLTEAECGTILGLGGQAYRQIESGATIPRRRDLDTLSRFYGLSVSEAFPMFDDSAVIALRERVTESVLQRGVAA